MENQYSPVIEGDHGISRTMFRNTFQIGCLSILDSTGNKPLEIWTGKVRNGHIKLLSDNDIQSQVLEMVAVNFFATYITSPADLRMSLGIELPVLVIIIKKLSQQHATVEVQVRDDTNVRRRFQGSTQHQSTCIRPFICNLVMDLDHRWNRVEFDLADMTQLAYGTKYLETVRVKVHPNCRIRRVFFSDRLYSEDELPDDFKLYKRAQNKAQKEKTT